MFFQKWAKLLYCIANTRLVEVAGSRALLDTFLVFHKWLFWHAIDDNTHLWCLTWYGYPAGSQGRLERWKNLLHDLLEKYLSIHISGRSHGPFKTFVYNLVWQTKGKNTKILKKNKTIKKQNEKQKAYVIKLYGALDLKYKYKYKSNP